MSAFLPRQPRFGGRHYGPSFPAMLVLALASAAMGAVVALFAERIARRYRMIEVLPAPAPIRQLRDVEPVTTTKSPASSSTTSGSSLGVVAASLSASRAAELEQLVANDDDAVAGDGGLSCPADFSIKGNGRSGIYHWPGSHNYPQTHPTLCFRTTDAAERAGFRRATR